MTHGCIMNESYLLWSSPNCPNHFQLAKNNKTRTMGHYFLIVGKAMRVIILSGLMLAIITSTATAQAQSSTVYVWRDATGAKHYGDRASSPVQAVSRVIATNPGAATSTQESESPAPTAESLSCEAARHNLTILSDQSMGVASVNDAGVSDKSVPMNEKERTQALAKANREVKAYCLILGAGKPKAATNPTSEQSASRPSQSGQF
jgi:hypothetical protein